MIKKTLYCTLLLLLIYLALVAVAGSPDYAQSQWQNNVMRAEAYLYGPKRDIAVVGSSLAYRLPKRADVYNLAFAGMGALDGLEIITVSGSYPKVVLIETNIVRERNDSFLGGLKRALPIKRAIVMFREQYNPVSVFLYELKALKRHLTGQAAAPAIIDETAGHDRNLQMHVEAAQVTLDARKLAEFMEALKGYVTKLQGQGTKVFFVELPMDRALGETPLHRQLAGSYATHFPTGDFIVPEADFKAQTTDGIHLVEASAEGYLNYVLGKISR